MGIIASFDKHPVYLDNDGNPLASGKIHYYAIGTTTPKTVYSDYTLTTPAANPQICGADGRTPTQIFLGTGEYTCISRKFNGTDPNTAPDTDWDTVTSQWVEEGQPTPSVASLTEAVYVTTIANLRLIDANALGKTNFMVMGYWSEGDVFPRTYHWDALSLLPDNKGTVIKNPSISTGAFILDVGNTDVMDCRIFGIIHNRAASNNAAISAMVTEVQNNAKLPQTIYFPRGIYEVVSGTQYFDTKVIFDYGCQFKNTTSSTPYIIGIRSTFENNSTLSIKSNSSTGDVLFNFLAEDDNAEVDIRWFGAKLDGLTNDGLALEKLITYTTSNYKLLISGGVLSIGSLTGNIVINNTVVVFRSGSLSNQQTAHTIEFENCELINKNSSTVDGVKSFGIYDANLSYYKFDKCQPIPSSIFSGNGNQDMSDFIVNINANITGTQTLLIEDDCFFGSGIAVADSTNWSIVWKQGTITTNDTYQHYISDFSAPQDASGIIDGTTFNIVNGTMYAKWFKYFIGGLRSAFRGNSTLDLNGGEFTCTTGSNITDDAISSTGRVRIVNGTVTLSSAFTMVTLANPPFFIEFIDLYVYSAFDSTLVNAGTSSTNIVVDRCQFTNLSGGSAPLFVNTGSIKITTSGIRWVWIIADSSQYFADFHMHGCGPIVGGIYAQRNNIIIDGNDFNGFAGNNITARGFVAPIITNNHLKDTYIQIHPYNSNIACTVTENVIESSDVQSSGVMLVVDQSNTYYNGVIVTGNRFCGNTSTSFDGVQSLNYGAGSVAAYAGHKIHIYDNVVEKALTGKITLKETRGYISFTIRYQDIPAVSVGDSVIAYIHIPTGMFIPAGLTTDINGKLVAQSEGANNYATKYFSLIDASFAKHVFTVGYEQAIRLDLLRNYNGGSFDQKFGARAYFQLWW